MANKALGAVLTAVWLMAAGFGCEPNAGRVAQPVAPSAAPSVAPSAGPATLPLPKTVAIGALEVRRSTVKPSLSSYALARADLTNLAATQEALKQKLGQAQLQRLEKQGFVLQAWAPPRHAVDTSHDVRHGGRIDNMVDLYGEISGSDDPAYRAPEDAVFISSDVLLHMFHVLVDRNFQRIEERQLQPRLREMTQQMFRAAASRARKAPAGPVRESLERVSGYLLVALTILEAAPRTPSEPPPAWGDEEDDPDAEGAAPKPEPDSLPQVRAALAKHQKEVPAAVLSAARGELELVMEATRSSPSPLWREVTDRMVDYSQFTPRSHYTRSAILRSYFRAMMWYGLMHFALESPELTRDAISLTQLMAMGGAGPKKPESLFKSVYEPTTFFVGLSDDATVLDYREVASSIYGPKPADWDLADAPKLEAFCHAAASKLSAPRIRQPALKLGPKATRWRSCKPGDRGLRTMGQRFIPDSYFFTKLTSGAGLPSTPTALMIMSVLGSGQADKLLDGWIATHAAKSGPKLRQVLGELKGEVAGLDQRSWGSTMYYGWLFALRPLLDTFGEGYPMFMRGDPWSRKGLLSALGSWTELRHDTLLYAKQSGVEKGGDDTERQIPPVPKGYVEPNMEFLARLAALARMTRQGLTARGLLDERHREPFEVLERILDFCTTLAEKELADHPISDDEYENLRQLHNDMRWALAPVDADVLSERDARAAVIADVHTDAATGQVLYEATGAPMQIFVAVKDRGGARLTRGAVYSYYELTAPSGSRLTDEQWHGRVYGSGPALPPLPAWVKEMTQGR